MSSHTNLSLQWLAEHENYRPDFVVHLRCAARARSRESEVCASLACCPRPTCPIRNVQDIDRAIAVLVENSDITAVRSMSVSKVWAPCWGHTHADVADAGQPMEDVVFI